MRYNGMQLVTGACKSAFLERSAKNVVADFFEWQYVSAEHYDEEQGVGIEGLFEIGSRQDECFVSLSRNCVCE